MSPRVKTKSRTPTAICLIITAGLSACSGLTHPGVVASLPPGARYVSMGSSFAAGPGITVSADSPSNRCSRSRDNYANQLARKRGLVLIDVSCSGATTAHVIGPWDDLPPQIESVTPETRLVTMTIGGNDVSYVRDLIAFSCAHQAKPPSGAPDGRCPDVNIPTSKDWQTLDENLAKIASEVRRRAPQARLVFVQYLPVLSSKAECAAIPLTEQERKTVVAIADRLTAVTQAAAKRWKADVVYPAKTSTDHGPCSSTPWISGFPREGQPGFVPYHPTLAGMSAIAQSIDMLLSSR